MQEDVLSVPGTAPVVSSDSGLQGLSTSLTQPDSPCHGDSYFSSFLYLSIPPAP